MRVNLKLVGVGMAVAGSVGLLAPTASAAPRGLALGEAVVNCVDTNANNQTDGDELAVLTPLDNSVTEPIPVGATKLTCTNNALSSEPVTVSVPAGGAVVKHRVQPRTTTTLQPGQTEAVFVLEGELDVGFITTPR